MAILYGTTSGGDVLPVQVDQAGRLVAEGLDGAPGAEGPQGPQGPEGPEGPNVLLPYGADGTVLVMRNGVPVWEFPPIEPPAPPDHITLLDDRDLVPVTGAVYSIRNDSGLQVSPSDSWNDYIRTLPCWSTPREGSLGLALTREQLTRNRTFAMPFRLELAGGFDKVLTVTAYMRYTQDPDAVGSCYLDLGTTAEHLTPIHTREYLDDQDGLITANFTYLVSRDDIGLVDFTLRGVLYSSFTPGDIHYVSMQKFEYVDLSTYLARFMHQADGNQLRVLKDYP